MIGKAPSQDTEDHWVSISDLMSVLMAIFLLISISYMYVVKQDKDRMKQVAITAQRLQPALYRALSAEFTEAELLRWGAEISEHDLTIRFRAPEVLFATGDAEVSAEGLAILSEFFPRYVSVLRRPEYVEDIAEIRVEGHTSSVWGDASEDDAYIKNMTLSQGRTVSVLKHLLSLPEIQTSRSWRAWRASRSVAGAAMGSGDPPLAGATAAPGPRSKPEVRVWLKDHLTANGLSSSKLRRNNDGTENTQESQRVEFRVRTNTEEVIAQIIAEGGEL